MAQYYAATVRAVGSMQALNESVQEASRAANASHYALLLLQDQLIASNAYIDAERAKVLAALAEKDYDDSISFLTGSTIFLLVIILLLCCCAAAAFIYMQRNQGAASLVTSMMFPQPQMAVPQPPVQRTRYVSRDDDEEEDDRHTRGRPSASPRPGSRGAASKKKKRGNYSVVIGAV